MAEDHRLPARLVIVAGTYDGVLAGWDTVEHAREDDKNDVELKLLRRNDGRHLKLSFAMAAHEGSVRCLDVAGAPPAPGLSKRTEADDATQETTKKRPRSDGSGPEAPAAPALPGTLLSGGYDENLNVFNLQKHSQVGELKTPSDLGSPLCCSFAPPSTTAAAAAAGAPTHVLVGLTSGKIVLYKRRDWSVQHVLAGHDGGGVHCLAVHPTGRLALTGGRDGKIVLWDLTKGRLAFVHKLPKGRRQEAVNHIIWSDDGSRYAYSHGAHVTARDVAGGETLLDVTLPARVNEVAFVGGPEGLFLAAACDDGGLPLLEVGRLVDDNAADTRRALMAVEPVDRVVAGDARFKCVRSVEGGSGFLVVTANSGGVVSLMDLEGAARMMLTGAGAEEGAGDSGGRGEGSDEDSKSEDDSDDEIEAAVEILDSVRIGSGARITDLAVWSCGRGEDEAESEDVQEHESENEPSTSTDDDQMATVVEEEGPPPAMKRRGFKENRTNEIELDAAAVEKARKLVGQAKKRQKKKKKKKQKLAEKS